MSNLMFVIIQLLAFNLIKFVCSPHPNLKQCGKEKNVWGVHHVLMGLNFVPDLFYVNIQKKLGFFQP